MKKPLNQPIDAIATLATATPPQRALAGGTVLDPARRGSSLSPRRSHIFFFATIGQGRGWVGGRKSIRRRKTLAVGLQQHAIDRGLHRRSLGFNRRDQSTPARGNIYAVTGCKR